MRPKQSSAQPRQTVLHYIEDFGATTEGRRIAFESSVHKTEFKVRALSRIRSQDNKAHHMQIFLSPQFNCCRLNLICERVVLYTLCDSSARSVMWRPRLQKFVLLLCFVARSLIRVFLLNQVERCQPVLRIKCNAR